MGGLIGNGFLKHTHTHAQRHTHTHKDTDTHTRQSVECPVGGYSELVLIKYQDFVSFVCILVVDDVCAMLLFVVILTNYRNHTPSQTCKMQETKEPKVINNLLFHITGEDI